jgi:hypothetical protein
MRYTKPNVQKAGKKELATAANFAPPPAEEQGAAAKEKKQGKNSQRCDCKKK